MGIFRGPRSVTNGLYIHLDPANEKSYISGSTETYSLSGTTFTGSLFNGVGQKVENTPAYTFNGVDQKIRFGTGADVFPFSEFTFEIAFKSEGTVPTTGTQPGLIGFTFGVRLILTTNAITIGADNGIDSLNQNSYISNYKDSKWHIAQWRNDGFSSSLYMDNELIIGPVEQPWTGSTRWPSNVCEIGRDQNNDSYYFTGSIGHFKLYTRYLGEEELQQNYNAVKSRYGL